MYCTYWKCMDHKSEVALSNTAYFKATRNIILFGLSVQLWLWLRLSLDSLNENAMIAVLLWYKCARQGRKISRAASATLRKSLLYISYPSSRDAEGKVLLNTTKSRNIYISRKWKRQKVGNTEQRKWDGQVT